MTDAEEPWYEVVEDSSLLQGDLLDECPIIIPPPDFKATQSETLIPIRAEFYNVVVMSQSCDIQTKKVQFVLVCPYWPLQDYAEAHENFEDDNLKEMVRQGNTPGFHMINECTLDGFERNIGIVSFREVYGVSLDLISEIAKEKHLRIRSPYREHLSHAFGSFFSRVALPTSIRRFID